MSCEYNNTCDPCNDNRDNFGSVVCSSTGNLMDCNNNFCDCGYNDQIIVKGVCSEEKISSLLGSTDYNWTELFVPEVLCIPPQKPDIEEIVSVTSRVKILSQKVIKTPIPADSAADRVINLEDTNLTGRKLVIEGVLRQKVVYVGDVKRQSLHSAHFDVPFSAFIVINGTTPLTKRFKIQPCIEDIFITKSTKRQVFKNVTLFIKATEI